MEGQNRHPIEGLMKTALDSIKAMIDVNTILGEPVETPDGNVIVPVSRVSFGFASGGVDYQLRRQARGEGREPQTGGAERPFGGGSGAGVSLHPVAFLVVGHGHVRLLPVSEQALWDRLIDLVPRLLEQLQASPMGARRKREDAPAVNGRDSR